MKTYTFKPTLLALLGLAIIVLPRPDAQGEAFTYQGRLTQGGTTASGNWDLQFKLYDAPVDGSQIGSTLTIAPVVVNSGLFTATLDFGAGAFDGSGRWIEVGARTNGSAFGYTNLFPRVAVLPAPYAINAGNGVPVGSVMAFMGNTPPSGWLLCNGSELLRTNFAALFAVIGTSSGAGDGSTSFRLPDLRGMFLRGVNGSTTATWADPEADSRINYFFGGASGNNVGSLQFDATRRPDNPFTTSSAGAHTHTFSMRADGGNDQSQPERGSGSSSGTTTTSSSGAHTHTVSGGGDTETRPRNVYVHYIIKF